MNKDKHSKNSRRTKLIIWIYLVFLIPMLIFFIYNIVNDLYYQPINYTSALGLALGNVDLSKIKFKSSAIRSFKQLFEKKL